jgi:hypothetical protein
MDIQAGRCETSFPVRRPPLSIFRSGQPIQLMMGHEKIRNPERFQTVEVAPKHKQLYTGSGMC